MADPTPEQIAARRRAEEFNAAYPSGTPVLAWPGTRDEEPISTRTRYSAWVLGSGEPVVTVIGTAGGIYLDHIEHDPTRQPAVPDVEFEMPPCPIDQLCCYRCRASWTSDGRSGSWNDPSAARCPATCHPYFTIESDLIERCVLGRNHDLRESAAQHRSADGLTNWTDDDARALVDGTGEAV
ncbi:hypothetical protein [Nocardioides sp.]|uniref:hypothetical protein n=1 Tax=Nocardioides sp. TaxID=35761 RepID=UPI002B768BD4|nr:hypothetical protein [Nocardioides sp.]HXH77289.1 hypothetical protein [Nocardioides sp.]